MLKKIIRPGEPGYQQCSVTIMDTTDPDIRFDNNGVSNWVYYFKEKILPNWRPEGNPAAFESLIKRIKEDGKGKEYDCALGLSGGVDSSYLAYIAKREGLRPLVVHTDAGWNSQIAVKNIENIVKSCDFDLFTVVIDWDEMADIQRAFLRAGVPNQDIPQDHAIFAAFYGLAAKHRIKWILSGQNIACESILPRAWGHDAQDLRHIKAIHRRYGRHKLGNFPCMGALRYGVNYTLLRGIRVAKPLDLMSYSRGEAIQTLEKIFGWRYYGGKHFESRWTRFFQGWWLPTKFGYDKRLAHLSSLILSDQLSRYEALEEMKTNPYTPGMIEEDRVLVLKKLGLSEADWNEIMSVPARSHYDYPTSQLTKKLIMTGRDILKKLGLMRIV